MIRPAATFIFPMATTLSACAVPPTQRAEALAALTFVNALNETSHHGSRTITPVAVLEDSRCPASVQCIQAGTVRIQVRVKEGVQQDLAVIGLNQPVAVGRRWLHLLAVCPHRGTPEPLSASSYRFTFAFFQKPHRPTIEDRCT